MNIISLSVYHSLQVVSDSVSMHKDGFQYFYNLFQYFFKTTSKTPTRLGFFCPIPFFLGGGWCPRELLA